VTSKPVRGHNHQSILRTFNPHNCLSQYCFPLHFDGLAHYGFASSLSIHMLYTTISFPLTHTQPIICTAMLTNKSTNGPRNISLQAVVTALLNLLTPNDSYMGRTAPLTSERCILYIYSTNIGTEYFKHARYSPFFFLFKMQFVSLC
jgi:hypothetical protein